MTHRGRLLTLTGLIAVGCLFGQEPVPPPGAVVRFRAVDVVLDSGTERMAAYQLELAATAGRVKIVGIEGGEHAAFKAPPYYDPKAIQQERAVLAAFNTASSGQLPSGRTRVATIHFEVTGAEAPKFATKLQAAARSDGRPIPATIQLTERNAR